MNSAQKVLSARPSHSYFPAGNHWANDKFLVIIGDSWDEKRKKQDDGEMEAHKTFKEIIYSEEIRWAKKLCIHALSDLLVERVVSGICGWPKNGNLLLLMGN